MQFRVYRVSECDWYAASSAQEARDGYVNFVGSEDCAGDLDEIEELTAVQMKTMMFHDEDAGETRTFEEELKRLAAQHPSCLPGFFASTEW